MDEILKALSDRELHVRMKACGVELDRLRDEESAERRVRQWIAGIQADFKRLGPTAEIEDQLRGLGAGVLFAVPAIAKEVEAAVLAQVTQGLLSTDERQHRMEELVAERETYCSEHQRRIKALRDSGTIVSAVSTTIATAKVEFRRNGSTFREINGVAQQLSQSWRHHYRDRSLPWVIRADLVSGATPTGPPLDTWLPLTAERSWQLSQSALGSKHAKLSISIGKNRASASTTRYTLAAEVLPGPPLPA